MSATFTHTTPQDRTTTGVTHIAHEDDERAINYVFAVRYIVIRGAAPDFAATEFRCVEMNVWFDEVDDYVEITPSPADAKELGRWFSEIAHADEEIWRRVRAACEEDAG
jgi:hypothetical protein